MSLSAKKPTRIKTSLKDEALQEIKKEEVSKFNANIPKKLHLDFNVKCKMNGTTMTDAVIQFMKEYINK
jgi:predicted HicB family RNase H-like nuclease